MMGGAEILRWRDEPYVKGRTESMRMALLTFSLVGVQFTWGIEMTYCTPYLLSLGLSKSHTSLVWIAGPISGLIMQPIVGVIADRSKSRYGRRRPFMIAGSVVVAFCLLCMGWAKDIASIFVQDSQRLNLITISIVIVAIYSVDFAINAVQACCRALIVDTLPINKQQTGSAWSCRMVAAGHLVGYTIGTLDLVKILGPTLGDNQFKQLTVFAALALLITSSVTSWAVSERVFVSTQDTDTPNNFAQIIKKVYSTATSLPVRIQAICNIQLWSWIGWFPFHFYSTTYVGEIYFRYDAPHNIKSSSDALGDMGRRGSMALVIFSAINLFGALLLPHLIRSPEQEGFTRRPPALIAKVVQKFEEYKPDLLTAWIYGHILFTCTMIFAPFAHSFRVATFMVGICGISWSLSSWAPSTFMGMEVTRLSPTLPRAPKSVPLSQLRDNSASILPLDRDRDHSVSNGGVSGLYFGILNIYTTIPQFVGTFISMLVFAVLEPGKSPELAHGSHPSEHHSTDGPNAIAVCLFIGALSMVGAAHATRRLRNLYRIHESASVYET